MTVIASENELAKSSPKIPLRLVLVVPFVLQIFAAVGLTGWLSLRNGKTAVNNVTSQLRTEVLARINQQLNTYLETPHVVNAISVDAIRRFGLWNPDNRPLAKIIRTGKMPIPQEKITLVGWASCPSHQLMKRIFARGLIWVR